MKYSLFLLFLLLITSSKISAFEDFDFDGVEDIMDDCPNTLITDLVDINGCTIKSLQNPHQFSLILGEEYFQLEETDLYSTTLQIDYYYQNFSFQLSTSYLSSDEDSSFDDTYLISYYTFTPDDTLKIKVGLGLILPTYDSQTKNETDYISAINISYTILGVNIFGGYSHTTIKDEINIDETDIDTYNLGFGFDPLERLYSSISYNNSTTLYSDVENIETLSLYNFYSIDNSWFTTLTYQYGISQSASKHTLSLKVGYYF